METGAKFWASYWRTIPAIRNRHVAKPQAAWRNIGKAAIAESGACSVAEGDAFAQMPNEIGLPGMSQ
jgi:hypothetical protein